MSTAARVQETPKDSYSPDVCRYQMVTLGDIGDDDLAELDNSIDIDCVSPHNMENPMA